MVILIAVNTEHTHIPPRWGEDGSTTWNFAPGRGDGAAEADDGVM